jgi:hypothetical protein
MLIYTAGYIISIIIFLLFQTTVPRIEITGSDIFTKILLLIRSNDNPVNCLPSLHVFTCWLVIRAMSKSTLKSFKNNLIITTISFVIILSTLFTKQHAVLDVLSGAVLSEILICTVDKFEYKLYALAAKKPFSYFIIPEL